VLTSVLDAVSSVPLHAAADPSVVALGPDWMQADTLIASFGTYALIGICVVVFIETGLLFPFLPGDSLLFTAGMLVAQEQLDFPLWLLCVLLFVSAFAGVQVAYAIGRAHPVGVYVETFGTQTVPLDRLSRAIKEVFDLRPGAIVRDLDLLHPIYRKTAAYGHFGRELPEFTWERTDRVADLQSAV